MGDLSSIERLLTQAAVELSEKLRAMIEEAKAMGNGPDLSNKRGVQWLAIKSLQDARAKVESALQTVAV